MTSNRIRISVRLLMDILAGRTSFAELNKGLALSRPNPFEDPAVLARALARAEIVRGASQDDDDFIEFVFGPPDAVNGPYRSTRPASSEAASEVKL